LKYRPDIDGLRAIAVTSVVAYHASLPWVSGGFVGVDVFFVISGFLIGSLVYKEVNAGTFSIARFYERRAKRILPALFVVLLFVYLVSAVMLNPLEQWKLGSYALATLGSGSNILYWLTSGYFQPQAELSPLLMTWSLGIEEQFYILFPLIMLLLRRQSWRKQVSAIALLAAISLVLCVVQTHTAPTVAFYLLHARAWELAAGCLLGMFDIHRGKLDLGHIAGSRWFRFLPDILSLVGLLCIGLAITCFTVHTAFPGYAASLPVIGAVLLIASRNGVGNKLLSTRPFVFVGLISYSWYLWHWPLMSFARIAADQQLEPAAASCIAAITFVLAVLSHRFVEQPFRRSSLPTHHLLLRYGVALLVMAIPAVLLYHAPSKPSSSAAVREMESATEVEHRDPCLNDSAPNLKTPCVAAPDKDAVALLGDSHGAALSQTLRELVEAAGMSFEEISSPACPPLLGVSRTVQGNPERFGECLHFNELRLNTVLHQPNVRIVILAAHWSTPLSAPDEEMSRYGRSQGEGLKADVETSARLFESGLDQAVTALEEAGKRVVILEDNPEFAFDPMRTTETELNPSRRALASLVSPATVSRPVFAAPRLLPRIQMEREILSKVAAQHSDVVLYDLWSDLCNHAGCLTRDGDVSLYLDENHLSRLGAQHALASLHLSGKGIQSYSKVNP
jgi:peptidoglycan/LPS O-acetylase OafA/YrhL